MLHNIHFKLTFDIKLNQSNAAIYILLGESISMSILQVNKMSIIFKNALKFI